MEEIELLDGASDEFDHGDVSGTESFLPVFFGSALTNFGVETFLQHFLNMTTPPLPRKTTDGHDRSVQSRISPLLSLRSRQI